MSFTGEIEVQFQDLEQQTHAAELGMWVFMASEVLFFSGLFALYFAFKFEYGDKFLEAARHTNLAFGTAGTFILLTSSLLVALSIHAVKSAWSRAWVLTLLYGTIALGSAFLVLKFAEYVQHFSEGLFPGPYYSSTELTGRGARIFFDMYYAMTGLHAAHMIVGMILIAWMVSFVRQGRLTPEYHTPLELTGIYWHFVDVVWVFLWPMFYLLRK